jgi:hypothetical protein
LLLMSPPDLLPPLLTRPLNYLDTTSPLSFSMAGHRSLSTSSQFVWVGQRSLMTSLCLLFFSAW